MPAWGQILGEIEQTQPDAELAPAGVVRRKYLKALSQSTQRETILYYSGWLTVPNAPPDMTSLGLGDVGGFMNACSNMAGKDLDLFIHSPGGDPDAAEQIAEYLRTRFDSIRAIVPQVAMSAATMLALSADEVVMGAHSQLGPIDPQLTIQTVDGPRRASAQAIRDQFEMAKRECAEDPNLVAAWMPSLRMVGPGLISTCDHTARRAEEIVERAMARYMLKADGEGPKKAKEAAKWFGDAKTFLSHGRPVRFSEAREHHVIVTELEDDAGLQDAILSVHHATLISLEGGGIGKLIENNHDARLLAAVQVQQVVIPGPAAPQQPSPLPESKKPPEPPRKKGKGRRR